MSRQFERNSRGCSTFGKSWELFVVFLAFFRASDLKMLGVTVPFIILKVCPYKEQTQPFNPVTLCSSFVRSFVSVKSRGHDGLKKGDLDKFCRRGRWRWRWSCFGKKERGAEAGAGGWFHSATDAGQR